MIIIEVTGGLGNQLQQYAIYRKFVMMGVEARLDVSWFNEAQMTQSDKAKGASGIPVVTKRQLELRKFDRILFEACSEEDKRRLIGADGIEGMFRRKLLPFTVRRFQETEMYHPEIFTFEDMYISGYFACEKYFADIMYDLRSKIQFPPSDNIRNHELAMEMRWCNSVSVHVRRGDYLKPENAEMFGNICTDAYYEAAINLMKEKVEDAHFYIFSDDVDYVREKYVGEEYSIVDLNHGKDSFYDMWLMINCNHNICANSTFSFWGARLGKYADKIKIRPTIHKNSQVFIKEEMEDLWKGWLFISPEGKLQ